MTLIVAVKCIDGIVLGADGAATLGSMGQMTSKQSVKKLVIIDGSVVVGVSGPVGLGQRLKGVIGDLWNNKSFSGSGTMPKTSPEVMHMMRCEMFRHIEIELKVAQVAQGVVGQQIASSSALSSTVVAVPFSNQPRLYQFDQQGSPEEATSDLPFLAIGSGQKSADPFLGFVRRILWDGSSPTLADGIFGVFWTLDYAIKGEPAFVAEPKQIVTLTRNGKKWEAIELSEDELEEHRQNMIGAERSLKNYKSIQSPVGATTTTTPPPSPPSP